ncbi:MAG TPA: nucleotidyltransferase family protein [Devosia sp.]
MHLRFAGLQAAAQAEALRDIVRGSPLLMAVLTRARTMALNDWSVVSGAIYNTVWNVLTGRPPNTGIKDVDLFYWDDSDLSYEAEDVVIRRGEEIFADLPVPVEIRNQARVHLWYEAHFGRPCAPIRSSAESVGRFASKTHAVSVRLEADDSFTLHAPFGLDDLFSFRITANRAMDNQRTHETKGARAKTIWPEITLEPW